MQQFHQGLSRLLCRSPLPSPLLFFQLDVFRLCRKHFFTVQFQLSKCIIVICAFRLIDSSHLAFSPTLSV